MPMNESIGEGGADITERRSTATMTVVIPQEQRAAIAVFRAPNLE